MENKQKPQQPIYIPNRNKQPSLQNASDMLSIIPIGGVGDVTKNMYVYEYKDQLLIVDCGIGFADETMLGVDLLLPDISYLVNTISQNPKKTIVGMLLTHGHEDHIGALPYILPQLISLGSFPVYASPFTASLANEKLKEFNVFKRVQTVEFSKPEVRLGNFTAKFIHITHSVLDTSNIFIKTPVGNVYHGSDFKFDLTPYSGKRTDYQSIAQAGADGVMALLSDCLGSERPGSTPSEATLTETIEREMRNCKGKFLVTTFASNIARLNQTIDAAKKLDRKVTFVGRSLLKAKDVAKSLGYMSIPPTMEVPFDQLRKIPDNKLLLLVAGSQGQASSAMSRIANGEHKDIKLNPNDVVFISSDAIPGNEVLVNSLIDSLVKRGNRVIYSDLYSNVHVSGHGSQDDLLLLMSLTKPQYLIPIGGNYKHMVAYKSLASRFGYGPKQVFLLEDGQQVLLSKLKAQLGKKVEVRNIYVDEITGEEVESFVLRDRKKLSEGGVVLVMAEIDSTTGTILDDPEIAIRGFSQPDTALLEKKIAFELKKTLGTKKSNKPNWVFIRKQIGEVSERLIFKELRRRPLVLPIVIEV